MSTQAVLSVDQVVARIRSGQPPFTVIEDATGPQFGTPSPPEDREQFLAGFNSIVQDISHYDGHIEINFPAMVADALVTKDPQVRADMIALAQMNRADTSRPAGEIAMWTDILRGINATPMVSTPPDATAH